MVPWKIKLWVHSSAPLDKGYSPVICVPLLLLIFKVDLREPEDWRLEVKRQCLNLFPELHANILIILFLVFGLSSLHRSVFCFVFLFNKICPRLIAITLFFLRLLAFPRTSANSHSISQSSDDLFGEDACRALLQMTNETKTSKKINFLKWQLPIYG